MWSRLRRPAVAVDSHDARALRAAAIRTRIVRVGLVAAALALLTGAAASARSFETRERGLLPDGSTGVVVLDLSLSIANEDYRTVRAAVRRLIVEDAPIGLVVFSDVPYELLPPGTPASEMRPMLRLLVPPRLGAIVNPWSQTFRSGTRVSAALALAKDVLERDGVTNGSVFLVSDLETAPDDVPQLARTIEDLVESSIDLRVFALGPSSESLALFQGLLEEDAFAAPSSSNDPTPVPSEARSRVPVALLLLGALLFVALALHERFAGRLAFPRPERVG